MVAITSLRDERTRIWTFLWLATALFTLYQTTIPFDFTDVERARDHLRLAVSTWASGGLERPSLSDLVQNVWLFVPFGVLGILSLGRRHVVTVVTVIVLLAAVLSAGCELLQLFTVDRTTSMWDVATNVTGAFLGAAGCLVVGPVAQQLWTRIEPPATETRRLFPLLCSGALVCVAAWEPFDVTLDVGTVWGKVKPLVNGSVFTWPPLTDDLLTTLRFALLVILVTAWLRQSRRPQTGTRWLALVACSLLAALLEASQFLITSREPSAQDLEFALAGALLGAAMASPLLRVTRVTGLLTIATAVAAVPFYLAPFKPAPAHNPMTMVPFLAYYEFTSLQTVSHVIDLMLIYAPIGFVIQWSRHDSRARRAALVSGVIAFGLEYAQGWIVGRFPDLTDVGMAILGGTAGAAIARHGVEILTSVQTPNSRAQDARAAPASR